MVNDLDPQRSRAGHTGTRFGRVVVWLVILVLLLTLLMTFAYLLMPRPPEPSAVLAILSRTS